MVYLQISIKKTGRQNIPTGKSVPGGLKNKSNKIASRLSRFISITPERFIDSLFKVLNWHCS